MTARSRVRRPHGPRVRRRAADAGGAPSRGIIARLVWTTAGRLLGAALGTAVAIVAMGGVALDAVDTVAGRTDRLVEEQVEPLRLLGDLRVAVRQVDAAALAYVYAADAARLTVAIDLDLALTDMVEALTAYDEVTPPDDNRDSLIASAAERMSALGDLLTGPMTEAIRAGDTATAVGVLNRDVGPVAATLDRSIGGLTSLEADAAALAADDAALVAARVRARLVAASAVVALMAVTFGLVLSRRIDRPMRRTVQVLREAAAGDLTRRTDIHGRDEIAEMAAALDALLTAVEGSLAEVDGHGRALRSTSAAMRELSSGLAVSAMDADAALASASEGVEQVLAAADAVSTKAAGIDTSIDELVGRVAAAGETIAAAVAEAIATDAAVSALAESSERVGDIIRQVESIAEQTNLLALNATIEAARAGEAGKGFAIVAGEVKDLAHETATAAADIGGRIAGMRAEAAGAATALERIRATVEELGATQAEVAEGMGRQSAATGDIADASRRSEAAVRQVAELLTVAADRASDAARTADGAQAGSSDLAELSSGLAAILARFVVAPVRTGDR